MVKSIETTKLAAKEISEVVREMRKQGMQSYLVSFDDMSDWPEGDGAGVLMPLTIGVRGELTKREAKHAAMMWREACKRYPKAVFVLSLAGYNEDPREVWEFPDACRYVRWWARFAGMDDYETADRFIGPSSVAGANSILVAGGLGFLAACGVFGDELRRIALRNHTPTVPQ